jgi:hypothetical protein
MRRSAKPIKKPHLQGSIVFGSNTPNWLYRRCDNVRANRGQSLARMKRRVRVRQSAIAYEDALSVTQDKHGGTAGTTTASAYDPGSFSRLSPSHLSSHFYIIPLIAPHRTFLSTFLSYAIATIPCPKARPQSASSDIYCWHLTGLQKSIAEHPVDLYLSTISPPVISQPGGHHCLNNTSS